MIESAASILLFTDSDVFAGTERHVAELGAAVKAAGGNVTIACPAPSPLANRAADHSIPVLPIAKRGAIDRLAVAAITKFLRDEEQPAVHCHNGRTALLATIARSLARRGTIVVTQHFIRPNNALRTGLARVPSGIIHRWKNRRVDHVIAISDVVRDAVMKRNEASAERVTRVHNGVTIRDIDHSHQQAVRRSLGLETDVPLIVCAARLEHEKRVDVLIDAMAIVADRNAEAVCVIAGQGGQQADLQAKIERLGLSGRVRLLGFRDDVTQIIAASDLFVLPAEAEPFGLVILEAMEAAVPVIATDAGGPREIVVPGQTGWLVRPNDPAALATAIEAALADPARAKCLGAAGRERLLREFTAERMARETIDVYRRAIEHSKQSR